MHSLPEYNEKSAPTLGSQFPKVSPNTGGLRVTWEGNESYIQLGLQSMTVVIMNSHADYFLD